jgi:hypothetical protein
VSTEPHRKCPKSQDGRVSASCIIGNAVGADHSIMPRGLSKIESRLGKLKYLQATFARELQLQRLDTEPIPLLTARTFQHEAEPKDIRFNETLESDTRETQRTNCGLCDSDRRSRTKP